MRECTTFLLIARHETDEEEKIGKQQVVCFASCSGSMCCLLHVPVAVLVIHLFCFDTEISCEHREVFLVRWRMRRRDGREGLGPTAVRGTWEVSSPGLLARQALYLFIFSLGYFLVVFFFLVSLRMDICVCKY